MTTKHHLILACALLLTATGASAADDELVGDRPDFTESALTIAPGRIQVEAGATKAEVGEVEAVEIGELLVRIGVATDLELRLGLGSRTDLSAPGFDVDGWTDASLGAKWRFLDGEGSRPGMALLLGTSLPTGDDAIGAEKAEPEAILAAEWDLSEGVALGTNLGLALPDGGDGRYGSAWLSAAFGFSLTERLGLFVEGFAFTREEEGGDSTGYGDLGFTWLVEENFQLDLRAGRGFNGEQTDCFAGLGVIVRR